ncbi:hypothetical protein V6N13_126480 [Hibiscus sabdariffa]
MLQLADHSYVHPEGKIEDILVQIDKFIFPADFLILDCEADEHAPIILGRPFLSTSRAVIDFDKDEIIFKVDENNVKMKSITKKLDKGKGIAESPAKDIPRTKLYMGAHVERDRAAIISRRWQIFPPTLRANFPPRPKMEQQIKARLGAVLKQFKVDDIQNLPRQQLWHLPGQRHQISHLPRSLPRQALDKKYKLRPRRLPKLDLKPMRKEDVLEYKQQLLEVYFY